MKRVILMVLLAIVTLGAVGFEDKKEMVDCYLTKPEVMDKAKRLHAITIYIGEKQVFPWDTFVDYVNKLDEFQLAIFKHCGVPVKKALINVSGDSTDTTDLLLELMYTHLSAEAIAAEDEGLQ